MIATLGLDEERNPLAMAGQRRFEKERIVAAVGLEYVLDTCSGIDVV